jgi:hypothetical protein
MGNISVPVPLPYPHVPLGLRTAEYPSGTIFKLPGIGISVGVGVSVAVGEEAGVDVPDGVVVKVGSKIFPEPQAASEMLMIIIRETDKRYLIYSFKPGF